MRMQIPPFPTDLDWHIYGLDGATAAEPYTVGYGYEGAHPLYGKWRMANFTLHYGDFLDPNLPHYLVVSAPHFGESALRQLHGGLGAAGFVFGMSGTGHISGALVPPERLPLHLDGLPIEADAWRGESAEVAWIETDDTWIVVLASKKSLTGVQLTRIVDVNPLIEALNERFGRPGS